MVEYNRNRRGAAMQNNAVRPGQPVAQGSEYSRYSNSYSAKGGGPKGPRKKSAGPKIAIAVAAVLIVILGVGGFFGFTSVNKLKNQAKEAQADVTTIKKDIKNTEFDSVVDTAEHLSKTVKAMESELNGPVWTVVGVIPVIGEDVRGAKAVVSSIEEVSNNAITPLANALKQTPLSDLVKPDHSIDVAAMDGLLTAIAQTAPAMDASVKKMEAIPDFHIPQLQSMIGSAKSKIIDINTTFQSAGAIAPVLGNMLGVNGDRHYLVVAQNSAEMRSLGGFPGSIGILSMVDGKISMQDFKSPYEVLTENIPEGLAATDQEMTLFSAGCANFSQPRDCGLDPDYPRVAKIWATSYEEKNNTHVDGVVAMTPSVVQGLLKCVGSVKLSDGTVLDGDNATRILEYELYDKYFNNPDLRSVANERTDNLFAETASLTFNKLFSKMKSSTLMKVANTLLNYTTTREFLVWMTDESEQAKIAEFGASGSLQGDDANRTLGVFYSDVTGSKLGWFVDLETTMDEGTVANGKRTYNVKTKLASTLSVEEATEASAYIVAENGKAIFSLYLYAPAGGSISDVAANDGLTLTPDMHCGRQVYYVLEPKLYPSDSYEITYKVEVPEGVDPLTVISTPTLTKYR